MTPEPETFAPFHQPIFKTLPNLVKTREAVRFRAYWELTMLSKEFEAAPERNEIEKLLQSENLEDWLAAQKLAHYIVGIPIDIKEGSLMTNERTNGASVVGISYTDLLRQIRHLTDRCLELLKTETLENHERQGLLEMVQGLQKLERDVSDNFETNNSEIMPFMFEVFNGLSKYLNPT